MQKRKKAEGLGICLSILILMALLIGNAGATATVTDSVTVSGSTATFNINITGGTNITDIYLYYSTNVSAITTEVANWTSQTGTTFSNTTTELTGLAADTYYYKICFKDNTTWDNTTTGSFVIASSGLALLGLSESQASEVGIILTYGLIFGLWFIISLFLLALYKAKQRRKKLPMVNMSKGLWLGIALLAAMILTFVTWYLLNVYLTTDYLSSLESWFSGLF